MGDITKLVIISHRRKKHIFGLMGSIVLILMVFPIINSLSLGQGSIISSQFQHTMTEVIGSLFLVYFGSVLFQQYQEQKTLQLLWSKKKEPLSLLGQLWLGIYSIYAAFVIIMMIIAYIIGHDTTTFFLYTNLLISGAILLTITLTLSLFTNSYMTMIMSLILYLVSYSINFILFSTPGHFQKDLSYQILTALQHLFPRFDILYSTITTPARGWSIGASLLYGSVWMILLGYIFLSRYAQR